MNYRVLGMMLAQVGVAVGLSVGTMQVMADDEGAAAGSRAAVSPGFTFQGRLDVDGLPANGLCDFTFQQFDSASGGVAMSALQAQQLNVQNGIFSTVLTSNVPFLGEARWVQVAAGCGVAPVLLPSRVEITATPYALSLRTPAQMHGDADGGIIHVFNSNALGEGIVSSANTAFFTSNSAIGFQSTGATSAGLFVKNAASSGIVVDLPGGDGLHIVGADEDGVDSSTDTAAHYGGRFVNASTSGAGVYARGGIGPASADLILGGTSTSDSAGRIISDPGFAGSDLYFYSNDQTYFDFDADDGETGNLIVRNGTTQVFEIRDTGDVRQANTAFGIPKLAMRVSCSGVNSSISSFRKGSMTGSNPTETTPGTATAGECSFDAGFSLTGHYIVVTPISSAARTVTFSAGGSTLSVYRWEIENDATPVVGSSGSVDIIIY